MSYLCLLLWHLVHIWYNKNILTLTQLSLTFQSIIVIYAQNGITSIIAMWAILLYIWIPSNWNKVLNKIKYNLIHLTCVVFYLVAFKPVYIFIRSHYCTTSFPLGVLLRYIYTVTLLYYVVSSMCAIAVHIYGHIIVLRRFL